MQRDRGGGGGVETKQVLFYVTFGEEDICKEWCWLLRMVVVRRQGNMLEKKKGKPLLRMVVVRRQGIMLEKKKGKPILRCRQLFLGLSGLWSLSWRFRSMALDSFGARNSACMVWLEGEGRSVLRDLLEGKEVGG